MSVRFINPYTLAPLRREPDAFVDDGGNAFPVVNGVPRFCELQNYSQSFGTQWNLFAGTQLDRPEHGLRASERRFFAETGWAPESLEGLDVLEVGSGAGRFSKVVLERTRARLWSVDYSTAVEANFANNCAFATDRFQLLQASVYELPFPDDSFDRVFCLGVLQHTPDFEASVRALISKTKPGGEIAVDFYPIRGWWTKLNAKYMLRPFSKRIAHDRLMSLIDRNVDWMIAVAQGLNRLRLGVLTRFLPMVDLRIVPPGLTKAEFREWTVLDTFDMFSPEHDHPQRLRNVAAMFRRHGADVTFSEFVETGSGAAAVVRAVKRAH
ncbi:MAG TPA: class I SAM-dependent methyltransferase [Allosphingosinicella sp.]|jgi:SAM-dependent methyltransferase